jgi:methyl-accepting chemotaxis protein
MRIELGYKFILGFIVVVALAVLVPYGVSYLDLPEWAQGIIPPLAAIAVGLSIGSIFSRRLSRSVGGLLRATRAIADGDLRQAVDLGHRTAADEFDDLAEAVNGMLTNLRQMVAQVLRTSSDVAAAAQNLSATAEEINASGEEISVTMEEVARSVTQQKGGVERVATRFHELDRGLEAIAGTCRQAASSAREAEAKAQSGSQTASQSIQHLAAVFRELEESARVFVAFSERIQQIHRFAEVITNLSRQTNLLALNAAIEASKAGDEGKGFAVVASEIRKLADSAERSADQIAAVLTQLDEESRRVRTRMETTGRQVTEGREGLDQAGAALDQITGLVSDNTRRMEEILRLAGEQSEGSRQIAEFVREVEAVAEANASAAHEVSTTIEHQTAAMEDMAESAMRLSQMAEELTRRVERFQVPEEGK